MFISSFCSKPLIWVLVSFPSLLVSYTFSFISLFIAFTLSYILRLYSTISVSILITSVFNCASDTLAISSTLSCIFSGALICSFIWAIFFVLAHLLGSKGQRLRYSPVCHCIVVLYVGEASEREQCPLLSSWPAFSHFSHYPQGNWAFLVLIPGSGALCTF